MKEKFINRTSIRDFDPEHKLTDDEIKTIKEVINNSPTSTNGQQFSAIIITDEKIKKIISKHNWNQQHILDSSAFIVFLADRTRSLEIIKENQLSGSKDMLMHEYMRSTIDATIAATYTHDALMTMGYGVVFVGGVTAFANVIKEELNLPDSVFPIVGLSFGKTIKENPKKMKMDKVFINRYNKEQTIKNLNKYEKESATHFQSRGIESFKVHMLNSLSPDGRYIPNFEKAGQNFKEWLESFE